MKALYIPQPGAVELRDVPSPSVESGEALVAVRLAGICRTDLELAKGYMNFTGIPGHEFVGRVVAGPEHKRGCRVVGEINAACGQCRACKTGQGRHCAQRTVLGIYKRPGAFAELLTLPPQNLLVVPDNVTDEEAVFVEPLAAALEIFEQIHIPPGSPILIVGDGKLGLLVAQVCAVMGLHVVLFGHHEKKLALAARWKVATVRTSGAHLAENHSFKYPYVVECTGAPTGFATALSWVEPRGTLILKSTYAPAETPEIDWSRLVVDEITVLGSRCGPFAPAVRLLAQGKIDVRSLVDHRKTLEQGEAAFELAAKRGSLKVLLEVNPGV